MLVQIAMQLTTEEWTSMSYTFNIPKSKQPHFAIELFVWMHETGIIGPSNLEELITLLEQNGRNDLAKLVDNWKRQHSSN